MKHFNRYYDFNRDGELDRAEEARMLRDLNKGSEDHSDDYDYEEEEEEESEEDFEDMDDDSDYDD